MASERSGSRARATAALVVSLAVAAAGVAGSVGVVAQDVERTVTIDAPETYAVGSAATLSGEASADVRAVALYVRRAEADSPRWWLLDVDEPNGVVPVANGSWSATNLTLSEASRAFALPGEYEVGVVAARDARAGPRLLRTLSEERFANATSARSRVTVTFPPPLAPTLFADVVGEVATEDGEVAVSGRALGRQEVLVGIVDSRGRLASAIVAVEGDGTFEEDVELVRADGEDLAEGRVVATVLSTGRDGVVGDGRIAGFSRADLEALDENTRDEIRRAIANESRTPLTQAQVLELLYEESVNDTASDDQVLVDTFVYTDGRTEIRTVTSVARPNRTGLVPVVAGDGLLVRGTTNRKAGDTAISVEVTEGHSADEFEVGTTSEWGALGVWSVTLNVTNVDPGNYTVEADDGDSTDTVEFRVVTRNGSTRRALAPPNGTATNRTATPGDDTTGDETDTRPSPTGVGTTSETTTDGSAPGLGALAPLVALCVFAALLARRP